MNPTNKTVKGKRKRPGRRPLNLDSQDRAERSRTCARDCRVRKKLRYQFLADLVTNREKSVFRLRKEIQTLRKICTDVDRGIIPESLNHMIETEVEKQGPTFPKILGCTSTDTAQNESTEQSEASATCKTQQTTLDQESHKDATNTKSSQLLSYLNVSFSPEVEEYWSDSSNSALEKELFGQLILELQKTVDSTLENKLETERSNEISKVKGQSTQSNSDENCESSDSSDTKNSFEPDDKDTPILDWILQNGNLFEHRLSDADDSDVEQISRPDEVFKDSASFNGMEVKDYVIFLTSLSKLNSSIKLEGTFEEQYKQLMDGKSPPKFFSIEKAHSDKMECDEDDQNGQNSGSQLKEQPIAHRKDRRSKSVNIDDHKTTLNNSPIKIQRSVSSDVMADEVKNNQGKFPFLSFLLKNKNA